MTGAAAISALLIATAGSPAAHEPPPAQPRDAIIGTLSADPAVPPANAVLRIFLEEQKPDGRSDVVASYTFERPRRVQGRFTMPFHRGSISPDQRYTVRAIVTVGKKTVFSTTAPVPVLAHPEETVVELRMLPVDASPLPVRSNR